MLNKMSLNQMHFSLAVLALTILGCAASSPEAQLEESIQWYTGELGSVDDSQARRLLELSATDGNAMSVMWLARVYSTGRMTFEADKDKAVSLATSVIDDIEAMANQGNSEAMLLMGTAYAEGLAKEVDPEMAVQWYRDAAALNNTLALHNLGNVYASGTGVPQDDELAAQWWLKAAHKGDAIPQLRLGGVYEQGRGVEKDIDEAVRWYSDSASRGNQAAAAALKRLLAES
jgi:TPR repeat protein